jgi:hypothetical protein
VVVAVEEVLQAMEAMVEMQERHLVHLVAVAEEEVHIIIIQALEVMVRRD